MIGAALVTHAIAASRRKAPFFFSRFNFTRMKARGNTHYCFHCGGQHGFTPGPNGEALNASGDSYEPMSDHDQVSHADGIVGDADKFDNAWDWLYLADILFRRNPAFLPEQFPGFNRVPDSALADSAGMLPGEKAPELHLHAPAAMTFLLKGDERRLRFDYGFRPGAYSEGGHTDGAGFRIELQNPAHPGRVLFERYLDPGKEEKDRGPQQLDLALPAVRQGDRLVVSIDTGPALNAAWDWTYIHHLRLQ